MAKKKKPKRREPEPAATDQPLIFLDIDGVICCNMNGHLEEPKLQQLRRIVEATGAKVVLSTDWRRQARPQSLNRRSSRFPRTTLQRIQ